MPISTPLTGDSEERLLVAAQRGDDVAYEQLIEPYRGAIHVHCYRMLGSLHDADDALQETLLRAWRALPKFAGPRLFRAWLYRIATNTCLDLIARRPTRLEPYPVESLAVEDSRAAPEARYEQREAVELAFVAALQHLSARQRAVLVLREVLGFSAREVAGSLDTTVASVNSALQRARRTVEERLPERTQQATLRALGDATVVRLAREFVHAWERGDTAAMVAALTEDVAFTMPPDATCRGADAIDAFLPAPPAGRWRLVAARANGQLAFGAYRLDPASGRHHAAVLDVVRLRGARIAEVVAFEDATLFPRFGLPDVHSM